MTNRTAAATATVWEGSSPVNMARVVGYDNANINQASVSELHYMVTQLVDGVETEVAPSTELTVTDVIFDTLQTGNGWTEDTTGYNFRHQLAATDLPDGGVVYTVTYRFEDTSGKHYFVSFELTTKEQPFS